jgi:anti-sigma B factor antagonist
MIADRTADQASRHTWGQFNGRTRPARRRSPGGPVSLTWLDMQYRPEAGSEGAIVIDTGSGVGVRVVAVSGEVDVYSGSRLRAALGELIDESDTRPVVVDLTAVTLLSSTGCAVLVDALGQAQRRSRPFALVVDPTTRAVPLTLHAAGLVGLFTTYADVDEARRAAG